MLKLIPNVKKLTINNGFLSKKAIRFDENAIDNRLLNALKKLPIDADGAPVTINIIGGESEEYQLVIDADGITINAQTQQGAFYAVQTLRQIFMHDQVPFVLIQDKPDFAYRGFYHDVTRGKVPTVKTLKKLIDDMAFYKLNSFQLYVEHTFDFKELSDEIRECGVLTAEELQELNDYCKQNFIEFIPSMATFGHLYEILNQDKYKDIRCVDDTMVPYRWQGRSIHHTLDPVKEESFELVKSLIDQYAPNFDSEYFNIGCDETFDLTKRYEGTEYDVGKLYLDFVKKIIAHLKAKNKTVMMWADVLLEHPEIIEDFPEDTCFLNWNYTADVTEENIAKFAKLNRKQIVCPGTSTWKRFCENVNREENNISRMVEYGYKNGAIGVLNTNWGDWGNMASLELAMYGLVLGAEKSWSHSTQIDDTFYDTVNFILYKNADGIKLLKMVSKLNDRFLWYGTGRNYNKVKYGIKEDFDEVIVEGTIEDVQNECKQIEELLSDKKWENDEFRIELLLAAQGVCICAEQYEKLMGKNPARTVDVDKWLEKFSQKWLEKNKPSELFRLQDVFNVLEK